MASQRVINASLIQSYTDSTYSHPKSAGLTVDEVVEIRKQFDRGISPQRIAKRFRISENYVKQIGTREAFADLPETPRKNGLTDADRQAIRKLLRDGKSERFVRLLFGLTSEQLREAQASNPTNPLSS